jgi:Smg protein
MRDSIVDVIVYMLEIVSAEANKAEEKFPGPEVLEQELENAGFSPEAISNTYDWLRELIEKQRWYAEDKAENNLKRNPTIRIFDPVEMTRLSLEVRSFILSLDYAGILDTKMREIVINQLMKLGDRVVELPDVKWVVLMVLMSKLNKNIDQTHNYFLAMVTSGA